MLVTGVSARAAVESAMRAGFRVTGIDAFGDLASAPSLPCLSLPRDFGRSYSARAAARASREVRCDTVVYTSNFENHPAAVATLARGRRLWGNLPAVLRHVRDPIAVSSVWRARGVAAPSVRLDAPDRFESGPGWMMKPFASGGGRGVARWPPSPRAPRQVPRHCCLQAFVEGTPASVAFVAAGGRAFPLALSRQIVGDPSFGASGYRYCGNVLAPATDAQFEHGLALLDGAATLAGVAADAFGLVGLNGIDAVARDGVLHPIEINPRWSASMELVERAHGLSVFGLHVQACEQGSVPDHGLPVRGFRAVGKAIVFARRPVTIGDTRSWLADDDIRDVPQAGERIRAGHAVCTVLASAGDGARCYTALVARAAAVYEDLARWEREAA